MKKFLVICVLMISMLGCEAKDNNLEYIDNPQLITLIYLNGAYVTDGDIFSNDVKRLHPNIKKQFENDPLIYKNVLDSGKKIINPEPIPFYWGDASREDQSIIDVSLTLMKSASSLLSQFTRATLAHILHDTIWVNKLSNHEKVANKLNELIIKEHKKGHQVILLGYSAGTLISSNYMTLRVRALEIEKIFDETGLLNPAERLELKKAKLENTCLDAVLRSKLSYYTMYGDFEPNKDSKMIIQGMKGLNKLTENYCLPDNTLKGVINFGNPTIIFEAGALAENSTSGNITLQALKYVFENNIFYLNVNYAQDPIAMPFPINPTRKDFVENIPMFNKNKITRGFLYDKSDLKIFSPFFSAHSAYWKAPKIFAKNIVKAYNEGYNYFFSIDNEKEL